MSRLSSGSVPTSRACLGDELTSPQDVEAFRVLQRNGRQGNTLLPARWARDQPGDAWPEALHRAVGARALTTGHHVRRRDVRTHDVRYQRLGTRLRLCQRIRSRRRADRHIMRLGFPQSYFNSPPLSNVAREDAVNGQGLVGIDKLRAGQGYELVSRKQRTAAKHAENGNGPCEPEPRIIRRSKTADLGVIP